MKETCFESCLRLIMHIVLHFNQHHMPVHHDSHQILNVINLKLVQIAPQNANPNNKSLGFKMLGNITVIFILVEQTYS